MEKLRPWLLGFEMEETLFPLPAAVLENEIEEQEHTAPTAGGKNNKNTNKRKE